MFFEPGASKWLSEYVGGLISRADFAQTHNTCRNKLANVMLAQLEVLVAPAHSGASSHSAARSIILEHWCCLECSIWHSELQQ